MTDMLLHALYMQVDLLRDLCSTDDSDVCGLLHVLSLCGLQATPSDVRQGLRALNKGSVVGAFQAALLSMAVTCGRRGTTIVAIRMRDVVWTITATAVDDSGVHVQHASMAISFSMEKCMDIQGKRQLLLDSTGNPFVQVECDADPALLCLNWAVQMGAVALEALDSCCIGDVVPQVPGTEDW